jgi:hypothetical protein
MFHTDISPLSGDMFMFHTDISPLSGDMFMFHTDISPLSGDMFKQFPVFHIEHVYLNVRVHRRETW